MLYTYGHVDKIILTVVIVTTEGVTVDAF